MGRWLIAALIVCGGTAMAEESLSWPPDFAGGVKMGVPQHPGLVEISGLVASRKTPGVLWVHNDSGGGPVVYALNESGVLLATVKLPAIKALDWEDIAIGPGEKAGEWYIYVGDTGNNNQTKKQLSVVRFPEPDLEVEQTHTTITLPSVERFVFTYPNPEEKVYDCETLLVDPLTSELFFVTKGRGSDEGRSYVFRAVPPFQRFRANSLELVDRFRIGKEIKDQVTGGDVSPDGRWVIVRTYTRGRIWQRPEGGTLVDAFKNGREPIPIKNEPQGEAIAFAHDGKSYFTVSEQNLRVFPGLPGPQPIYRYVLKTPSNP